MQPLESPNECFDVRDLLRDELAACAVDLRALERWQRQPRAERGEAPLTSSGLDSVGAAKLRATLLHLGLAHLRHRLHLRVWQGEEVASLEAQAARLAAELARLDKVLMATPVLDDAWRARLKVILARP